MFHSLNLMGVGVTAFASAFALSGGLVALTIRICLKRGWVAKPRSDRWHRSVPSLFGGLPIWFTFVVLSFIFLPLSDHAAWKVIGASTLMFLLGFVDDLAPAAAVETDGADFCGGVGRLFGRGLSSVPQQQREHGGLSALDCGHHQRLQPA